MAALAARTVGDHRAVDLVLQLNDLDVVGRLDDDDVAAVLRDRNVAAVAHLGDVAPHALGVGRAAGLHGVDQDAAVARHLHHLGVFHVLRIIHVRRRVADQEQDAVDLGALRPGQLGHADVQRLVDAFRPVAAAARLQLQEVGVQVLDVGRQRKGLGDVLVADVAIGDQADADFGAGIFIDDRGRDRPDLALGAFDQRPHRAGGVEHERDLDDGLFAYAHCSLACGQQGEHKKSEGRNPRADGKHVSHPLLEKPTEQFSRAIGASRGRNCGWPPADLWRIWVPFVGRGEARYEITAEDNA